MIDFNQMNERGAAHEANPETVSHVWVAQPVWQGLMALAQEPDDHQLVHITKHEAYNVGSIVAGMASRLDQTEVERDALKAEMAVMEEALSDSAEGYEAVSRRLRRILYGLGGALLWGSAIVVAHLL